MQLTSINKHFNACDQKWDDMPQQGNGRHCQQCDRVLVDLTNKTEQQVLDLQVQHNFKHCGRYTLDQVHRLDRYLTLQEQPKRSHMPWLVKLAMGLGASGLPMLAAAQTPLPDKWIEQALPSDTLIDIYPGYHSPWVRGQERNTLIKGSVQDEVGETMPFCDIIIVGVNDSVITTAVTNFDGIFELSSLNDKWHLVDDSTKVKVSALGYKPEIILLKDLENDHLFKLEMDHILMGEVIVQDIRTPISGQAISGLISEITPKQRFINAINPAHWYRRIKYRLQH